MTTHAVYYGTKRIEAWPEQKLANPPDGLVDGYAVRYQPDGYTSWSPKAVFEATYQPITAMSFGNAIVALKDGYLVARAGWSSMWLQLIREYEVRWRGCSGQRYDLDVDRDLPWIGMRSLRSFVPWIPSQTDMLADDWRILADDWRIDE